MFIIATISCFLVVLSLVHFLMALSANYAHIRGHDKFTELQVNFQAIFQRGTVSQDFRTQIVSFNGFISSPT
jgi:hypothetical protein